ncbi:nuclear receptor-binding factor 2b [Corythoichthys intestinalis]|uniref:nuclear receptor-binding factor 2b n=1 Tax=Corythoichthys intestinalis TaxID=161448 RepID=UPI0025A4CF31|nr:nuclear receptor-binding factor 2b [Corythoichthys intestinalis]XP_061807175.1 nuclear receptor-binding factor 2-like [Nerophis lumbriciformis]
MTVHEGHAHPSCSENHRRIGCMEVVDSPLNLAHQQCRKADRFLAAGKYEEAISCHGKAADLLTEAMKTTDCQQARVSMELQRDRHIKQQHLIQERWKREARREATKARPGLEPASNCPALLVPSQPSGQTQPEAPAKSSTVARGGGTEREYDTLLYQLQTRQVGSLQALRPCPGSKTSKDDKTRLEEQQTTIEDLRRLVDHLMDENQRLASENERLQSENARLRAEATDAAERSELWVLPQPGGAVATGGKQERKSTGKGKEIAIPQLPPLEMPAQEDLCLDDLPPLELPEDIQNELQELLDKDKL